MPKIKVDDSKYPRPYWPQELKDEGFVGDLIVLNDAFTATIVHPEATLEQVKKSLQVILRDVGLRIEREQAATKRRRRKR